MTQRFGMVAMLLGLVGCVPSNPNEWAPGATEFVNEEPTYSHSSSPGMSARDAGAASADSGGGAPKPAPKGRTDVVEEG